MERLKIKSNVFDVVCQRECNCLFLLKKEEKKKGKLKVLEGG